jgi:hypothetical protein
MPSRLSEKLSSLQQMSKPELEQLRLELFKTPRACQLRRELIIRILAYRLQEVASGTFREGNAKELRRIARSLTSREGSYQTSSLKPGTRLIREWKGKTHVVHSGNGRFEYRGSSYQSLSEIARLITGTRWSGPLFFGLKVHQMQRNRGKS